MTNRIKGEVPLELDDGRKFTLLFDHAGLVHSESAYGKPLHMVLADASAGFMGATSALLYGALRAHHPALTSEDVLAILFENTETINKALSAAHEAAMPAPSASTEGKAPRQAGKTSGSNGAKPD
jgi:hypothetical protein